MFEDVEPEPATDARRFEARLSSVDRSPFRVAMVVAAFVGLAILKPWAAEEAPTAVSPAVEPGRPGTGPASTNDRAPASPVAGAADQAVIGLCHEPGSWRTATIETWRDQTVRVWRAIEPETATRPLDPTIPIAPAVGESVPAIGFCAPTSGAQRPTGPASVRAWRVDGDAVQAVRLRQIAPVGAASPYGALYGPPAELGATSSWPNGRVVFRYEDLATRTSRWFAIEVSGTSDPQPTGSVCAERSASPTLSPCPSIPDGQLEGQLAPPSP